MPEIDDETYRENFQEFDQAEAREDRYPLRPRYIAPPPVPEAQYQATLARNRELMRGLKPLWPEKEKTHAAN